MSDSELSSAPNVPGDDEIEKCLRRVVKEHKKKTEDPPSVNQIRDIAAKELGFDVSVLKGEAWKTRSKDIVHDAFNDEDEPTPKKPQPKNAAPKPKAKAGTKRKSDEDEKKQTKRRKKARKYESEEEEEEEVEDVESEPKSDMDEDEDDDFDVKPAKKPAKRQVKKRPSKTAAKVESDVEDDEDEVANPKSEDLEDPKSEPSGQAAKDESELSDVPDKLETPETNGKPVPSAEEDDSDMSVLIDEPPQKKRGKKAAGDAKEKPKGKAATKAKAKPAGKELSPDEQKIKDLQGWLLKCGIRKVWARDKEFSKCETSKEKIKHLTKLLEDVGMTPRYSEKKAQQIKQKRELAAELDAVQEFEDRWGQGENEDDEDEDEKAVSDVEEKKEGEASKRRLPKGFVDFGDSGDEGSD